MLPFFALKMKVTDLSLKPQHNFAIFFFLMLHTIRYKKIIVPKIAPGVYSRWETMHSLFLENNSREITLKKAHSYHMHVQGN